MRVTTQMLNSSAQKAGLPTNRTSLLNYINGNNSKASLENVLSKSQKTADATKKADYEKLEKSADQAAASAEKLLSAGSDKVTATDVQTFVDKYNAMLKNLGKSSDTLSLLYAQTARDTVKEYKQELAGLGVTVEKDGALSFDKAAFEKTPSADTESLSALFAKEGGLFSKLDFLASRVSDYADANAESYSGYYNAVGARANAYSNGMYNFRG